MEVEFVAMIPSTGNPSVRKTQKIADSDTPIRIYGGGNMIHLANGWQVFSAHTIRGRGMVIIPPRGKGQSEQAWKRSWIRGYWGGSGVYKKVVWNDHKDFHGQRMVIDMRGKRRELVKKALEESGLIHFRQIQHGITYFVCEEDV